MIDRTLTRRMGPSVGVDSPWWKDARVRAVAQILFLIGMSGVAAAGKNLHPSMGIPGSSAVYWLAPLVAGRLAVKRDGAGLFMGAGMAVWGMPIGLEHTFGYNVALYGITGLVLDLASRLPGINIRHVFGAVTCGLMAHMVKWLFIVFVALSSGVVKHFLVVGLLESALLHAGFGVASGLFGWGLFKTGHWAAGKR